MMSRRRDARRSSTRTFLAMFALLALLARPVAAAAFQPACAALASATALTSPALKVDSTPHAFDRVNDYVYVRANVTTSDALSGLQNLFYWGGEGSCGGATGVGGMLFGLTDGQISFGRQCGTSTGFYFLPLAAFEPAASAQFVVEVYYRAWTDELRIWVDDVEVTPTGTRYALEWSDGYASAGTGGHEFVTTDTQWGGTIHAVDFYECAWTNTPAAAPSPPAPDLESLKVHLVAEDFNAGTGTWDDRILGLSFANSAGIAAPTLVDGAMNGRKALRFGITDAGAASASGVEAPTTTFLSAAGQTGVTVFVVYRPIAYNADLLFPFLFDMGMLATAGFGFGSEVNANNNFFTMDGVQLYTSTAHGGLIQRSVFESEERTYVAAIRVKFSAGADDPGYQLAASQDSDVAVGDIFPKVGMSVAAFDSTTVDTAQPFSLGTLSKAYNRANRFFRGYVAEFRWYADLLSDADVEAVQRELSEYSFFSASSLKSAVDNCVAATIDPDLTLYPSCVAPAVPSGSGRFCCSLCGANCLHGGATDMPNWDVSRVTSFEGLFQNKTSFDEDVTGWSVPADADTSNMFLGATAFLAKFANCNSTATPIDPNACRRKVYPPSLAAFDGPPAAWDNRHCDFSASVVANGALGECDSSDVPKGSMCAPTCEAASALAVKGVCGHEKQTPPACVCECKDKMAGFGFVVEQ